MKRIPPVPATFFDWGSDHDPEHVGAVFLMRSGIVHTIEGNSGGKVAVHSYALGGPQIHGLWPTEVEHR